MSDTSNPNVNETADETDVEAEIDVAALLRGLSEGTATGRAMTALQRRACVRHLLAEGFSNSEMVEMLQASPRTITRDRAEISREQAVQPDRRLGDRLLGQYQAHVENVIARLTRLSRDGEEPAYARMWADEAITRIYHRFLEMTRKLTYFRDGSARLNEQAEAERKAIPLGQRPLTMEERARLEANAMFRMVLEDGINRQRAREGKPPLEGTLNPADVMAALAPCGMEGK